MEIPSPTAYLGRKIGAAFGLQPVADPLLCNGKMLVMWNHLWVQVRFYGQADLVVTFYDQGDGSLLAYFWGDERGHLWPLCDAGKLEHPHFADAARDGLVTIDDLMDGGLPDMTQKMPREGLRSYLNDRRRSTRRAA